MNKMKNRMEFLMSASESGENNTTQFPFTPEEFEQLQDATDYEPKLTYDQAVDAYNKIKQVTPELSNDDFNDWCRNNMATTVEDYINIVGFDTLNTNFALYNLAYAANTGDYEGAVFVWAEDGQNPEPTSYDRLLKEFSDYESDLYANENLSGPVDANKIRKSLQGKSIWEVIENVDSLVEDGKIKELTSHDGDAVAVESNVAGYPGFIIYNMMSDDIEDYATTEAEAQELLDKYNTFLNIANNECDEDDDEPLRTRYGTTYLELFGEDLGDFNYDVWEKVRQMPIGGMTGSSNENLSGPRGYEEAPAHGEIVAKDETTGWYVAVNEDNERGSYFFILFDENGNDVNAGSKEDMIALMREHARRERELDVAEGHFEEPDHADESMEEDNETPSVLDTNNPNDAEAFDKFFGGPHETIESMFASDAAETFETHYGTKPDEVLISNDWYLTHGYVDATFRIDGKDYNGSIHFDNGNFEGISLEDEFEAKADESIETEETEDKQLADALAVAYNKVIELLDYINYKGDKELFARTFVWGGDDSIFAASMQESTSDMLEGNWDIDEVVEWLTTYGDTLDFDIDVFKQMVIDWDKEIKKSN